METEQSWCETLLAFWLLSLVVPRWSNRNGEQLSPPEVNWISSHTTRWDWIRIIISEKKMMMISRQSFEFFHTFARKYTFLSKVVNGREKEGKKIRDSRSLSFPQYDQWRILYFSSFSSLSCVSYFVSNKSTARSSMRAKYLNKCLFMHTKLNAKANNKVKLVCINESQFAFHFVLYLLSLLRCRVDCGTKLEGIQSVFSRLQAGTEPSIVRSLLAGL